MHVALVGYGAQMANEYAPSISRMRIPVDFICDVNPNRLAAASPLRPTSIARHVDDLPMCDHDVLVVMTLPHDQYSLVIPKLIAKGYRLLLMEKPAALNLVTFDRLSRTVTNSCTTLFVSSKRRFYESYRALKAAAVMLGPARQIGINVSRSFRRSDFGWRADAALSGSSVLYDLGYHALDLAYWLAGDPSGFRLSASDRPIDIPVSLERAAIRITGNNWPCAVDLFSDRVAPSPFEQVVLRSGAQTLVATPTALFTINHCDKHPDPELVRPFNLGREIDYMLSEIVRRAPTELDEFGRHRFHIAVAETSLLL